MCPMMFLDQERRPHHADLGLVPKPGREAAGVNADIFAGCGAVHEKKGTVVIEVMTPASGDYWSARMPEREDVSTSM